MRRVSDNDDHLDNFEKQDRRKRMEALIPPRYQRTALPERLRPELRQWCEALLDRKESKQSILLVGNVGTGKTTAAYAMLRYLFDRTFVVPKVDTAADLCGKLRPSGSDASPEQTLAKIRRAPVLFIDELGVAKNSEWISQEMYRVIDHRSNYLLPTIYTANSFAEIEQTWGDRLFSRIAGLSKVVGFDGDDLRFSGEAS